MKKILMVVSLALIPAAAAVAQPAPGGGGGGLQRLREADANHDGNITRDEFKAYRTKTFDTLDKNKDGFLTADEIPAPPAGAGGGGGGGGGGMLQRLDANKDGKIDKAEYVNGSQFFDNIDTNKDGTLSKEELDAAQSRMQQQRPQ